MSNTPSEIVNTLEDGTEILTTYMPINGPDGVTGYTTSTRTKAQIQAQIAKLQTQLAKFSPDEE